MAAAVPLRQVTRRLERLRETPDSPSELGRLARDLGHALRSADLALLRDLRADLSAAQEEIEAAGSIAAATVTALSALNDLIGSYAAELEEAVNRQEYTQAAGQGLRAAFLERLAAGDRRPGELARELGKREDQVSRTLRELRALGLVEVAPAGPLDDHRVRLHRLTLEGRRAEQMLRAETGRDPCDSFAEAGDAWAAEPIADAASEQSAAPAPPGAQSRLRSEAG